MARAKSDGDGRGRPTGSGVSAKARIRQVKMAVELAGVTNDVTVTELLHALAEAQVQSEIDRIMADAEAAIS